MNLIDDSLVKRIRETVLQVTQSPKRALKPSDTAEDKARASIRQLSRSRISLLLRQLRAAHGLTYAQIQEQTGFSQQTLFDLEYKERRLSLSELRTLCDCYNITVNDLLGVDLE